MDSPRHQVAPGSRPPQKGTVQALAGALSAYQARNLLEALKVVPNTGDWHGELRSACELALADFGLRVWPNPNQTAAWMRERIARAAQAGGTDGEEQP